ncbi:MAG: (2Fe-2S)-binding protein [Gemmataceae bacterium]|nr:(2Fe-2S)-binding protein [Gemmataceae bacterium]
MNPDVKICYCFHVTRRKLLNFLRLEKPQVASQLSECGGAGTGCGWCVPYLKKMHALCQSGQEGELPISVEEYEKGREEHIRSGKGKPPTR